MTMAAVYFYVLVFFGSFLSLAGQQQTIDMANEPSGEDCTKQSPLSAKSTYLEDCRSVSSLHFHVCHVY